MEYTNNFGSQFPNSVIEISERKDVDDTVRSYIVNIQNYVKVGNLSAAARILNDNYELLEPYSVYADLINLIQEEIRNQGIYALSNLGSATVISDTVPTTQFAGYWLKDVEIVQ